MYVQYALLAHTENLHFAVNGRFMHRWSHIAIVYCNINNWTIIAHAQQTRLQVFAWVKTIIAQV